MGSRAALAAVAGAGLLLASPGLAGAVTASSASTVSTVSAVTAGSVPTAPDLAFTVVSTSPVYAPGDGSSVVFATVRNDTSTTLSLATAFAVTFYDASGAILGIVSAGGDGLSSALRAVPPGQLADVSARLPDAQASTAAVTDGAAAGSPYSDPRLPLAGIPERTAVTADTDTVTATVVNTSGYPDVMHLVVLAEDQSDDLLGALTLVPPGAVSSGSSTPVTAQYVRLPGEPIADHYDVLAEGLPDGAAAASLTAPSTSDTPTSGTPASLNARLLDGLGTPISGATVLLTARRPGKSALTLGHGRTDAHGRVTIRSILPAIGEMQLVFTGDATHAPVSTGDFAFRLHPRLTASVPRVTTASTTIVRGQLPDYPGGRLTVQELVHGHWRTVRSTQGDRSGGVHFTLHPGPGSHTYRMSVTSTPAHLGATSSGVTVVVR